jgi:hypothetical protein
MRQAAIADSIKRESTLIRCCHFSRAQHYDPINPSASRLILCVLFSSSFSLAASTNAGQVSGKILDPRGVAVAGAHLKLLNSAGEVIREAKSDDQGSFILDSVEPGEYQLRAEEPTLVSVILGVSVARGHQEQVAVQFRLVKVFPSAIRDTEFDHGFELFRNNALLKNRHAFGSRKLKERGILQFP